MPSNAERITIVGDQMPTTQLKGVRDIYLGGRPGRLMDAGPRSDGKDLLQIKRWPVAIGTDPQWDHVALDPFPRPDAAGLPAS